MPNDEKLIDSIGDYKYGFIDPEVHVFKSRKGLDRDVVEEISQMKGEPEWMLKYRLKAYEHFLKRPELTWGPDLSDLDLNDIYYYVNRLRKKNHPGMIFRTPLRILLIGWEFQKQSKNFWLEWVPNMNQR